MFSYIYMLYIGLVSYNHIANVNAQVTLQSNNVMPTQGNSLTFSCLIQDVLNNQAITWYRPKSDVSTSICLRESRFCTGSTLGYTYTANQSGAYLEITSVNRDQDEGTWKCGYLGSDGKITRILNITVYTLPTKLVYTKDVQAPTDLIVSNLSLQCKTSGCTYPPPVIKWYYKTQTNPAVCGVYPVGTVITSSVGSCSPQEQIYTRTLEIPLYTTWSDNTDKIVTFYCEIEYPDPSRNIQSADSGTVRFAVQLNQVELQQNSQKIPDTVPLNVTSGEQVTLTCIPGTSRPAPTIDWYIEMIKMSSGTSPYFTFTPVNDNHNKTVFCRAYNFDPSQSVDSQKPRLYVGVRVTQVELQQENLPISDTVPLNVTSGEDVTLTCIPGTSRPAPTIDWYIGTNKTSSGTSQSLTFIPRNDDHDKTIFCRAYNTDPVQAVDSKKPRLYVRVRVTQVELQQENLPISDTVPLNVTSGEDVTLTCIPGASRPAPTIDWYIGANKTSSGASQSLTFIPRNDDHDKTIFCRAYNTDPVQAVDSKKPRLYVRVAVTLVTLNISASEVVFYEGYPQMLTCISSPSRPVSAIRWFLGSRLLTDITATNTTDATGLYILTSQVFLTLMKNASNQQIRCEGFIDGQDAVSSLEKPFVNVWYKPSKPMVREYGVANSGFPWLENMTGTLQCYSSDYGNPGANVTWLSDRGMMDSMNNLVISGLMPSDDKRTILCKLVNKFTFDKNINVLSDPLMLHVEYHPIIKYNTSTHLLMNETQSVSVMCEAVGNPNPQSVQWKNSLDGSTLRFDNISRMDNGTYVCEATANSAKYGTLTVQKQIDITVQYAPDVKVMLNGSTQQNETARLICEVKGIPANYTLYTWVHMWEDMVIMTGLQGKTSASRSVLTIDSLSLGSMGTYVCTANNGITGINGNINQTGSGYLTVTGVPVAFVRDTTFIGETNMSASLRVPFFSNPLITELKFVKTWNNTPIANDTDKQVYHTEANISNVFYNPDVVLKGMAAVLYFNHLQESDFGQYTLILCNNKGNTTLNLHLNASAPPSPVEQFYFNKFVGQYMEFFFVPGFNGGHSQRFTIQFKPLGSLDEAWKNTSINGVSEMDDNYRLSNGTFLVQVEKLHPGRYVFRMFSANKKNITYSQEVQVYIEAEQNTDGNIGLSIAGLAGGIGGGVVVILVIGVVIFLWRRHSYANKSADDDIDRELQEREWPESGLVDNPVYEKSSPRPGESISNDTTGAMYASVVKTKNRVPMVEDPKNLYAQVEKTKKRNNKRGEIYENAYLPNKSPNHEDVYENSREVVKEASAENLYEDSGAISANVPQVNKSGLLYADLKLDPPTFKNGKYVIHGLENRTEYAEIDYGKRGDPLPDSNDEEERTGGTK